ncbi:MAG: 3-phosphoshikimate 1-carboxyvinyltransferase, partial [Gemmatimonadetes bacterium]|nr:3-phosphoshikimate 1-carboxyvinyltransferase [Gemmatimonadota bacterium]
MIELRVPGDKSISHRAILIGSLASDASLIRGLSDGVDVRRSIAVMRALGARIDTEPEPNGGLTARIGAGAGLEGPGAPLDCGNSGTTARLVAGILAGLGLEATLDGDASLRARPMRRVTYPLQAMGAAISAEDEPDRLPLRFGRRVSGSLRTLRHRPRIASAQVKSALLLAGLTGTTRVEITEPALSRDHTERMLRAMRAPIEFDPERRGGGSIRIDPEGWDGRLRGLDLTVPGDPSSAAFLIGAALLARRELRIAGVLANTGRIAFLEVLSEMGVAIERARASQPEAGEPVETWTLRPPARLRSFAIAGDRVPRLIDEIPLLCVLATRAEGRSEVRGAGELRAKESDRIRAIVENVRRLGGVAEERDDGLTIHGSDDSPAGVVRTFGDHRIAMAFGVLGAAGANGLEVDDRGAA